MLSLRRFTASVLVCGLMAQSLPADTVFSEQALLLPATNFKTTSQKTRLRLVSWVRASLARPLNPSQRWRIAFVGAAGLYSLVTGDWALWGPEGVGLSTGLFLLPTANPEEWDWALRRHLAWKNAEALQALIQSPEARLRSLIAITNSRLRVRASHEDLPTGAAVEALLQALSPRFFSEEWVSALEFLSVLGEQERARRLWNRALEDGGADALAPLLLAYERFDAVDARRRWQAMTDDHHPRFLQAAAWAAGGAYDRARIILTDRRTSLSDRLKGLALLIECQTYNASDASDQESWDLLKEEAHSSRGDYSVRSAIMFAVESLIRSARFDRVADLLDVLNSKDLDEPALALIYKQLHLDTEDERFLTPEIARRLAHRERPEWGLGFSWRVERQLAHRVPGSELPWEIWEHSKLFRDHEPWDSDLPNSRITVRSRAWLRLAEEAQEAGRLDLAEKYRLLSKPGKSHLTVWDSQSTELHREIGLYAARRNYLEQALTHLDAMQGEEPLQVKARDLILTTLVDVLVRPIGLEAHSPNTIAYTEMGVEILSRGQLRKAKHEAWKAFALLMPRSFERVFKLLKADGARLEHQRPIRFLDELNQRRVDIGLTPIESISPDWEVRRGNRSPKQLSLFGSDIPAPPITRSVLQTAA